MNELHRFLIKLDDPNKVERKRNYQGVLNTLSSKYPSLEKNEKPLRNHREVCVIWNEKLHAPILRGLRDESERVRELSAEITLFFFGHMACSSPMTLSYILPVLRQRLVRQPGDEVIETSEEVRLLLLTILTKILEMTTDEQEDDLKIHLDDLVRMLGSCIIDTFADVKEMACNDVGLLAKVLSKDFHFNAANLINPLAKSMTHQQKKVRVACIQAVGVVLHHSGFDEFQLIGSHLAQRLFDPVPVVRLSVSKVAGDLLMNWRCALSCSSMLIPLLLTSLEDESPSNREEIWQIWNEVGKKWLVEELDRDHRLKEQVDFQAEAPPPSHYPPEIKRANFGCRKYISKVMFKLLPALKNDLGDWIVETRIKTSQLTYILICHMEETAVICNHADTLLSLFFQGVKDSEVSVMKNMCRAAHVYGYFVPVSTWAPFVSQRLLSQATYTDLMVVSHIINGSDPMLLRGHLDDLALVLQDDSVCLTSNDAYLDCLLECCLAMIKVSSKDCSSISGHLFKIILTIDGLSMNQDLQQSAYEALNLLAQALDLNEQDLFRQELGPALKSLKLECQDWTTNSFRVSVFSRLLTRSGPVVGHYPDLIVSIFNEVLCKEEVEPELRLKMFLTLSKQMGNLRNTLNSQSEFAQSLALNIVTDLILPAVKWQAGRKNEAVRIAAVSSLWSVFSSESLGPKNIWQTSLASKLIPAMNRLLEDDSVKVRLFVCQSFKFLFEQSGPIVPLEYLVKICSHLMKRLDDVNDEVRLSCLQALATVTKCLPAGVSLENHLTGVYTCLLLHMDDSNEIIRNAALETLRITGSKCPKLCLTLTTKAAEKNVHKDPCKQLIDHLQTLKL